MSFEQKRKAFEDIVGYKEKMGVKAFSPGTTMFSTLSQTN